MADALQKFKSGVNKGIATITVKSSSALEKSKIKSFVENINRDIEKELMHVGDDAYKLWANGITDFSSIYPSFQSIKSKLDKVDELTRELNAIDERDNQIINSKGVPDVSNTPTKYYCTQCGTAYEVQIKFCRNCGNKMEY